MRPIKKWCLSASANPFMAMLTSAGLAWMFVSAHLGAQDRSSVKVDEQLKAVANSYVERGEIAGCILAIADRNRVLSQSVAGWSDVLQKQPLAMDSIFWIASMSKPIAGASVMSLVETGKLSLDDPISRHLPEMASLRLPDDTPAVITIRHLLTHTSGMAELGKDAYTSLDLSEAAQKYAKVKVTFAPGTKWQYSQTSINTAARIVEVVSGKSYEQFLEENFFGPLEMKDTTFYLSESQLARLAKSYRKTDMGLEEAAIALLNGKSPASRDRMPAANGGLFSTVGDYLKFCQMLLQGGEWNGKRILSPESVLTLRTIATDSLTTGFTPGNGWGIGCCVIREPQGVTESLSPSSFGHGGAYGTQAWIDPVRGKIYLLMTQRANFPNSDASDLRRDFQAVQVP